MSEDVLQIRHGVWPPEGFLLFFIEPGTSIFPDIGIGTFGVLRRKPVLPTEETK